MNRTPEARPGPGTERTWLADVVVVGARCAGAATAMLLGRSRARRARARPGELPERHRLDPRHRPHRAWCS